MSDITERLKNPDTKDGAIEDAILLLNWADKTLSNWNLLQTSSTHEHWMRVIKSWVDAKHGVKNETTPP